MHLAFFLTSSEKQNVRTSYSLISTIKGSIFCLLLEMISAFTCSKYRFACTRKTQDARLLYSLFFCTFDSFNLYFSPSFFLRSLDPIYLSIYLSTALLSQYFLLNVCHKFISFAFSKCLQFSSFKYDFLTCPSIYELIVFSHPSAKAKWGR